MPGHIGPHAGNVSARLYPFVLDDGGCGGCDGDDGLRLGYRRWAVFGADQLVGTLDAGGVQCLVYRFANGGQASFRNLFLAGVPNCYLVEGRAGGEGGGDGEGADMASAYYQKAVGSLAREGFDAQGGSSAGAQPRQGRCVEQG